MAHWKPFSEENGYERQGLQETSDLPAQFEVQAKKKRREQGKLHRGAQLANTGESCSRFKPYTLKLKQRACQATASNKNNELAPNCEPVPGDENCQLQAPGHPGLTLFVSVAKRRRRLGRAFEGSRR